MTIQRESTVFDGITAYHRHVFPSIRPKMEQLTLGQQPSTLLIACIDSRISPQEFMQSEPGELCVFRSIGNVIPHYQQQTPSNFEMAIDSAINMFKVKHIIVCGHSYCAFINNMMTSQSSNKKTRSRNHAYIDSLRSEYETMLTDDSTTLETLTENNVSLQIKKLKQYPSVIDALEKQTLKLHGWIYHFDKGDISFYNRKLGTFINRAEAAVQEQQS